MEKWINEKSIKFNNLIVDYLLSPLGARARPSVTDSWTLEVKGAAPLHSLDCELFTQFKQMTSPYVLYSLITLDYKWFLHVTLTGMCDEVWKCTWIISRNFRPRRTTYSEIKTQTELLPWPQEVIECSVEFFWEARVVAGQEQTNLHTRCYWTSIALESGALFVHLRQK